MWTAGLTESTRAMLPWEVIASPETISILPIGISFKKYPASSKTCNLQTSCYLNLHLGKSKPTYFMEFGLKIVPRPSPPSITNNNPSTILQNSHFSWEPKRTILFPFDTEHMFEIAIFVENLCDKMSCIVFQCLLTLQVLAWILWLCVSATRISSLRPIQKPWGFWKSPDFLPVVPITLRNFCKF